MKNSAFLLVAAMLACFTEAASADVTIRLGDRRRVTDLYSFPNNCSSVCYRPWSIEQTVEHYLNDSLRRDGFATTKATVYLDGDVYLAKLVGVEHIGVGWLGHDKANPNGREVEGHTTRTYSGVEAQTMHEHWDNFIKMLSERGFTDDQIGLILGGNYLRIWNQILPAT